MAAILAAMLLISIPLQAAGVHNISLTGVGDRGMTGTATTIVGNVAGSTPYSNVEVNMRIDQAPPANMVYQGWLVDSKDNYKLSLGAFNGGMLCMRQRMLNFDGAPYDSVAVSLEPANSSSVTPTTVVAQGSLPGSVVSASDFVTTAVLPPDEMFQRRAITGAFKFTEAQFNSLRMMGWDYGDIAFTGSIAQRCNKMPDDIAAMLSQGQTWDQISASCNMTTAQLFNPFPAMAVAGSKEEMGMTYKPGEVPEIYPPMYYQKYANGRPVISKWDWHFYKAAGYSWQEVAMAANIAACTGDDPDMYLRMATIQGLTWQMIAMQKGLDYDKIKDTSGWPFTGTKHEMYEKERMHEMGGERMHENVSPMPMTAPWPSY
jgi:hypothetical protein